MIRKTLFIVIKFLRERVNNNIEKKIVNDFCTSKTLVFKEKCRNLLMVLKMSTTLKARFAQKFLKTFLKISSAASRFSLSNLISKFLLFDVFRKSNFSRVHRYALKLITWKVFTSYRTFSNLVFFFNWKKIHCNYNF